jgi:hypothetical protein
MGTVTILMLRVVMAAMLAGSGFIQAVLCLDLAIGGDVVEVPAPLAVYLVLAGIAVQVSTACVWRLVTMVGRGTVFSHAAFRFVDVVFGAVLAASLLTFGLAVALAPGDAPPGIVLMVCAVALVVAGMALIVLVLRMLLAQAVARDREASELQAELSEVI